jgi:cytochrome c peroxidase
MASAIEAFEATLITPAPFDAWLNGDDWPDRHAEGRA